MRKLRLLCALCIAMLVSNMHGKTIYNTIYNSFKGLSCSSVFQVQGHDLVVDNTGNNGIFLLDSYSIKEKAFKYYLRLANQHSIEGKHYTITSNRGEKIKLSSTSTGIIFNYIDQLNYSRIEFTCLNTAPHNDIVDERIMTATVIDVKNGEEFTIKKATVEKPINTGNGYNVMGVKVKDGKIAVLAGQSQLKEVMTIEATVKNGSQVGCYISPGAKVNVERSVLEIVEKQDTAIATQWNKETLDRHFASSKDPFEGYWTYLDREMEDKWLRLGGRYTIAVVKNTDGYDLIYIDGAQVKRSNWKQGLLKGRLEKTIFTDYYNAKWIDATFRAFTQDVYATFESGVILNIKFPIYNSQVRFSKILNP